MAVNYHIKIDSIPGMSQIDGFADQIQVESFSWAMTQTTNFQSAHGGGAGKVNVANLTFTHLVDKASPKLMLACCTGQHIKDAVLTCRKVDGSGGVDFLKITLTDVLVSGVAPTGATDADTPTEVVQLAFASSRSTTRSRTTRAPRRAARSRSASAFSRTRRSDLAAGSSGGAAYRRGLPADPDCRPPLGRSWPV